MPEWRWSLSQRWVEMFEGTESIGKQEAAPRADTKEWARAPDVHVCMYVFLYNFEERLRSPFSISSYRGDWWTSNHTVQFALVIAGY